MHSLHLVVYKETVFTGYTQKNHSRKGKERNRRWKRSTRLSSDWKNSSLDYQMRCSSNIPEVPRWVCIPIGTPSCQFLHQQAVSSWGTVRCCLARAPTIIPFLLPLWSQKSARSLTAAESTRRCDTRSTALPRSLTRNSCTTNQHWKLVREENGVYYPHSSGRRFSWRF